MKPDDLDRIFSDKADIVPSSGFAARVMDAVHREASAPPPIPFPWKRMLPLAACTIALIVFIVTRLISEPPSAPASSSITGSAIQTARMILDKAATLEAGSVIAALLLSLASVKLSRRLI